MISDSSSGILTEAEHKLVKDIADVFGSFLGIMEHNDSYGGDLQEIIYHIHVLQNHVLAQAAARAYPNKYRLLGGIIEKVIE